MALTIVDAHTHVTEPPGLWRNRMSKQWAELVPRVERDPSSGREYWFIGETRVSPVGTTGMCKGEHGQAVRHLGENATRLFDLSLERS